MRTPKLSFENISCQPYLPIEVGVSTHPQISIIDEKKKNRFKKNTTKQSKENMQIFMTICSKNKVYQPTLLHSLPTKVKQKKK